MIKETKQHFTKYDLEDIRTTINCNNQILNDLANKLDSTIHMFFMKLGINELEIDEMDIPIKLRLNNSNLVYGHYKHNNIYQPLCSMAVADLIELLYVFEIYAMEHVKQEESKQKFNANEAYYKMREGHIFVADDKPPLNQFPLYFIDSDNVGVIKLNPAEGQPKSNLTFYSQSGFCQHFKDTTFYKYKKA